MHALISNNLFEAVVDGSLQAKLFLDPDYYPYLYL